MNESETVEGDSSRPRHDCLLSPQLESHPAGGSFSFLFFKDNHTVSCLGDGVERCRSRDASRVGAVCRSALGGCVIDRSPWRDESLL